MASIKHLPLPPGARERVHQRFLESLPYGTIITAICPDDPNHGRYAVHVEDHLDDPGLHCPLCDGTDSEYVAIVAGHECNLGEHTADRIIDNNLTLEGTY